MRISIKLKYVDNAPLPFNYNYFLSSAIYSLLNFGSAEFAEFLHNIGYKADNKTYKLFTFALRFEKYDISQNGIKLLSPYVFLIISSSKIDEFLKAILVGSFKKQELEIKIAPKNRFKFKILNVEEVPSPNFSSITKFTLLTPIVLSTKKTYNGKPSQYYFRYFDDISEINRVLNENLINKYEIIYNNKYTGLGVKLRWDKHYFSKRKEKEIIKKISFPIRNNIINVVGNLLPFELEGDINLMNVGYEAGFGEKNSMGFGMAKVING